MHSWASEPATRVSLDRAGEQPGGRWKPCSLACSHSFLGRVSVAAFPCPVQELTFRQAPTPPGSGSGCSQSFPAPSAEGQLGLARRAQAGNSFAKSRGSHIWCQGAAAFSFPALASPRAGARLSSKDLLGGGHIQLLHPHRHVLLVFRPWRLRPLAEVAGSAHRVVLVCSPNHFNLARKPGVTAEPRPLGDLDQQDW